MKLLLPLILIPLSIFATFNISDRAWAKATVKHTTNAHHALAKKLASAQHFYKQKKLDKAISTYASIILHPRKNIEDAKIQFRAATALAKMQRRNSPFKIKKHTLTVTSTAYSSDVRQTDSTPWIAAWGDRLKNGMKIIAVSYDLLSMGLGRGSLVKIHGIKGHFVVLDKMNRRWRKRIDIYTGGDLQAARRWGMQTHKISFLTGLDIKAKPTISRRHYYSRKNYSRKRKVVRRSPLQKALSRLKVKCDKRRPSCKRWIFLRRKKILRRFSAKK